jgi:glycosyltransferase involved in cell wall biosynthesis
MTHARHIAFVCPRFAEQGTVGGAETLLQRLAEHAAAAGRRVTFLTTCAQSHFTWENTLPPGRRTVGGLDVHYFPVDERDVSAFLAAQDAISRGAAVSRAEEETWIRNSVNSRALCDHLRERGADYDRLVFGPYLYGLTWFGCRIHPAKSRLVPCLHDEAFAHLGIMKDLFRDAAGFLFNSEPERDLARRLFGVPESKSAVVGMGLDPFEADPRAFPRRRGLDAPYVLYSGRREPLKNTPLLCDYLHAFRERTGRDVKLVFTGSGPIDAPPALRPHLLDAGFVTEDEKHEAMAGALAFVQPSVNESLGIVLLEAWMARAPALVHAGSAVLRWQCERSNGGLWFRHYPEFEEELLRLADHAPLREQLGRAGREYVLREYAWPRIEARMLEALDRE